MPFGIWLGALVIVGAAVVTIRKVLWRTPPDTAGGEVSQQWLAEHKREPDA
jgi:hypothetical protein